MVIFPEMRLSSRTLLRADARCLEPRSCPTSARDALTLIPLEGRPSRIVVGAPHVPRLEL